jgi:hypothetical protein
MPLVFLTLIGLPGLTRAANAPPASPEDNAVHVDKCELCPGLPALRSGDADLVITTDGNDGYRISVWLSKRDGYVHGRCYTPDGRPVGEEFRIESLATDGLLPVIVPDADGFTARWNQGQYRREQRFDSQCRPES